MSTRHVTLLHWLHCLGLLRLLPISYGLCCDKPAKAAGLAGYLATSVVQEQSPPERYTTVLNKWCMFASCSAQLVSGFK